MSTETQIATQYLTFYVAGGEYAVEIVQVREIIPYGEVTRLPRAPDFVRGLINVRGSVVPVIDLAVRLGLPETQRQPRSCVVIIELVLEGERTRIGMITDNVNQVVELGAPDIAPPPNLGAPEGTSFVRAVGKSALRFILILDIDAVCGPEAMRAAWSGLSGSVATGASGEPLDHAGAS